MRMRTKRAKHQSARLICRGICRKCSWVELDRFFHRITWLPNPMHTPKQLTGKRRRNGHLLSLGSISSFSCSCSFIGCNNSTDRCFRKASRFKSGAPRIIEIYYPPWDFPARGRWVHRRNDQVEGRVSPHHHLVGHRRQGTRIVCFWTFQYHV